MQLLLRADFGVKDKKVSFGAIFGLFKFVQVVMVQKGARVGGKVMDVTQKTTARLEPN